jgi:hypothetical protein
MKLKRQAIKDLELDQPVRKPDRLEEYDRVETIL